MWERYEDVHVVVVMQECNYACACDANMQARTSTVHLMTTENSAQLMQSHMITVTCVTAGKHIRHR